MRARRTTGRSAGFTVLEGIVVVAVIGILLAMVMPFSVKTLRTQKVSSVGLDSNALVRQCKSEAVRRNSPAVIRFEFATNELVCFVDVHGPDPDNDPLDAPDGVFNPINDGRPFTTTDHEIARKELPTGVTFTAPDDDPMLVVGFTTVGSEQVAIFETDGSVRDIGAFRVGDAVGNYLAVEVAPAATARVRLLKWKEATAEWKEQGEDGEPWVWF